MAVFQGDDKEITGFGTYEEVILLVFWELGTEVISDDVTSVDYFMP